MKSTFNSIFNHSKNGKFPKNLLSDNKHELKSYLHLILHVSNNLHRQAFFFDKIEQILNHFQVEKYFSEDEIFDFFKSNKRIILFLVEKEFIIFDEYITDEILSDKYENANYSQYFSPEIDIFQRKKRQKEILSACRINSDDNEEISNKGPAMIPEREEYDEDYDNNQEILPIRRINSDDNEEKNNNEPVMIPERENYDEDYDNNQEILPARRINDDEINNNSPPIIAGREEYDNNQEILMPPRMNNEPTAFSNKYRDNSVLLKPDNKEMLDNFYEDRKIGENNFFICQLIRKDSIEEFIAYINKKNIPLNAKICKSIYETNPFLLESSNTKLIEYAAFFGLIRIFQYLKLNNIKLEPSLWLYAIHGQDPEI